MSIHDKFNAVDHAALEKMSTQELNDLLRKAFDQPSLSDEDSETILAITEVLEIRQKNGENIHVDVDAAWDDFQKEYLPLLNEDDVSADNEMDVLDEQSPSPTAKKKRWTLTRVAGIAAAIGITFFVAGSLIPQADSGNLWNAFIEWTKESFGFNKDIQGEHIDYPEQLEELYNLLGEHGVTTNNILPKYIPEDYKEVDTRCDERSNATMFLCRLEKETNSIILQYCLLTNDDTPSEFQKNDASPEIYSVNGLDHFIIKNVDVYTASWSRGSLECSIQNVPSHDELIKMINSIYEE